MCAVARPDIVPVGVGCDLNQSDWEEKLIAAGYDRTKPTCWVLEGLLYYLGHEEAPALLKVRPH